MLTNWRNEASRQYAISTLQKNSGSLVVTGFVQERPTSITVDTGATVSIVRPDMVKDLKPIWCSCSLRTATRRPVKVYGKVEIHLRLGRLELNHQVLVADIVDEAILSVDVMNAYGLIAVSYTHLDVYKRQDHQLLFTPSAFELGLN